MSFSSPGKQSFQAKPLVFFSGNFKQGVDNRKAPQNTAPFSPQTAPSLSAIHNSGLKESGSKITHASPTSSVKEWFFKKGEWLFKKNYIQPNVRYAFDEIGGYTLPRIIQQWTRSHSITGLFNTMAAMEVGIREVAGGFTSTFFPGLLAKGIGRFIDKRHQTIVAKNIDATDLSFYSNLLQSQPGRYVTQAEFLDRLQKRLNEVAQRYNPAHEFKDLQLQQVIQRITKDKRVIPDEAEKLAVKLAFPNFTFRIRHQNRNLHTNFSLLLNHLRDLHLAPGLNKMAPYRKEWGKHLYTTLVKTQQKKPHQLWGLLLAASLAISIPFLIRLVTRSHYNEDAFPGSKELTKALLDNKPAYSNNPPNLNSTPPLKAKKFEFFPYLSETRKDNNLLPTLGTMAFFGAVLLMAKRRFSGRARSIFNPKDWLRIYEFDKKSLISTIPQLELMYGLVCGTHLAASRDDSEYRETGIRDCLLGWPTLTYGFWVWYRLLARAADKRLEKEFGRPLLSNEMGVFRSANSIKTPYFKNLGLGERTEEAVRKTYRAHVWIALAAAGINWALLALIEPKLSIWLTNKLELDKIKREKEALSQKQNP